jgi:beta-galactosidase beta subunit
MNDIASALIEVNTAVFNCVAAVSFTAVIRRINVRVSYATSKEKKTQENKQKWRYHWEYFDFHII